MEPIYTEYQYAPKWAYYVTIGAGFIGPITVLATSTHTVGKGLWGAIGLAVMTQILMGMLICALFKMTTKVFNDEVRVIFGYFPVYTRRIAIRDVRSFEAVKYNPIAEFGGWGIKMRKGWTALSMSGNLGVRIIMADQRNLLIGSARPDLLSQAIAKMSQRVAASKFS